MESSPGACNGRVCRNVYPLSSLLARGFQPVRFKALANDNSVVAQMPGDKPEAAATKTAAAPAKRHRR
jgi:hypothetical protein